MEIKYQQKWQRKLQTNLKNVVIGENILMKFIRLKVGD